jgi:ribosomal protein S27AE
LTFFPDAEERRGFAEPSSWINMQSFTSTLEERSPAPVRKVQDRVFAANRPEGIARKSPCCQKCGSTSFMSLKEIIRWHTKTFGTQFVSVIRNMFYSYTKGRKPRTKRAWSKITWIR